MAYAALGHLYGEIGESGLSAENTRKAWQFRDRASDVEKFFITATYELRVLGNAEKLQATCEAWAQSYPREVHAHGLLAGGVYLVKGNYEKAFEEARKAIALDPDWALGYALVADFSVSLGRLSEAQGVLEQAAERKLEIPEFLESRHRIAFMKGDRAGMERELALSRQKPEVEAAPRTWIRLPWPTPVTCSRQGLRRAVRSTWPSSPVIGRERRYMRQGRQFAKLSSGTLSRQGEARARRSRGRPIARWSTVLLLRWRWWETGPGAKPRR